MACAWATFFCYGTMMVISFIWGQRAYRIPYPWKKLVAYMVIVVLLFFIHKLMVHYFPARSFSLLLATVLVFLYLMFLARIERKELNKLPVIGRFFRNPV
jgi:FtsH-binding integral membrane protein